MKLISERMRNELTGLYGLCFVGNSIADNMVGQLAVKFVMKNTADVVHHQFAHAMPIIADILGDYAIDRNVYLTRPIVPKHDHEYRDITEMFKELLDYMVDLEQHTYRVIHIAEDDGDVQTRKMLDDFLLELKSYTALMLDFVDYIHENGDTPEQRMQMDSNIKKFLRFKPTKLIKDWYKEGVK